MRTDQIKVGACFLSTIDFAFAVPTSLLGPGRCWHVHAQPGERVSFQQHPSPRETLEPDDCVHVKKKKILRIRIEMTSANDSRHSWMR